MTPLTSAERRDSLMRIEGELDRQQQEAQRAGALVLASLIGAAIVETKAQLATC